jgi:hypothetical protein
MEKNGRICFLFEVIRIVCVNHRNHFRKSERETADHEGVNLPKEGEEVLVEDQNTYASLVFTMSFKNPDDTYFIAYHYPYTYSELQRFLHRLYRMPTFQMKCRRTSLCQTLGGNECPLLTITDFDPGILF